jgi:hypothetical protein
VLKLVHWRYSLECECSTYNNFREIKSPFIIRFYILSLFSTYWCCPPWSWPGELEIHLYWMFNVTIVMQELYVLKNVHFWWYLWKKKFSISVIKLKTINSVGHISLASRNKKHFILLKRNYIYRESKLCQNPKLAKFHHVAPHSRETSFALHVWNCWKHR